MNMVILEMREYEKMKGFEEAYLKARDNILQSEIIQDMREEIKNLDQVINELHDRIISQNIKIAQLEKGIWPKFKREWKKFI